MVRYLGVGLPKGHYVKPFYPFFVQITKLKIELVQLSPLLKA